MSDAQTIVSRLIGRCAGRAAIVLVVLAWGAQGVLAEGYPFEGTWVRADRVCSPAAPSLRTYTARELTSPAGRCGVRKVVFGSGEWEIFEECRHSEHGGNIVEKIRMMSPDMMILKQQINRLKIPRGRRFARCTAAAQPRPAPPPRVSAPGAKP